MHIDLSEFGLAEMLRCGSGVRKAVRGAPTMESAARNACRFLYNELTGPDGERACALVRCYKTHPYEALDADLQRFARRSMGGSIRPSPKVKCLTLLASAGDEHAWNDRRASQGHQAIPLLSAKIVEEAPMIAQLIRQFGLDLADVLQPSSAIMADLEGKTYGIFHVEEARGSPYIPAQRDFVEAHAVRSVVGFGGSLTGGDLFAVILFSRVHVGAPSADRFRSIALDLKGHFFPFHASQVFDPPARADSAVAAPTLSP